MTPKEQARVARLTSEIAAAVSTARSIATAKGVNNNPSALDLFIGGIYIGRATHRPGTPGYSLRHQGFVDGQLALTHTMYPNFPALLRLDTGEPS